MVRLFLWKWWKCMTHSIWYAELVVKYQKKKSIASYCTTDTSILTSIGNDFSYDKIFSRQIEP